MLTEKDYWWKPQSCPTCETEPGIFLGNRGGKAHRSNLGVECKIWRCSSCGLIFPNPMPIPKGGITQHYSIDPDIYFKGHVDSSKNTGIRSTLEKAHDLLGRTGKLLDVGSGRGNTIKAALELGWEVTGLEPSPIFAADARRRFGVQVIESSIEDCIFSPSSFDAVILSATLEHLYTPRATITKIGELLRPGGVVFMDVPNEDSLFCTISNLYVSRRVPKTNANLSPTFPPFHVFGFNYRSLLQLLTVCGLTPVHSQFYPGRTKIEGNDGVRGFVEANLAELLIRLSRGRRFCYLFEMWAQKNT
jgi:SAM-dependent methyltransferase